MMALADYRFWLRLAALGLVCACLVLPPIAIPRTVYTVVAVLDITGSMNVTDVQLEGVSATRISLEKAAIHQLLGALPCGSRLGLAIFVEKQPFLLFEPVEVCGNFTPLSQEIDNIDWRMGWDSESHIAETLLAAMAMTHDLRSDLVFLTDGQETPPLWWSKAPDFSAARGSVRGVIAGIGGTQFSPIPKFDLYGRQIGFFKPGDVPSERDGMFRGREHLSAVDEPHLRALALQSGLIYQHVQDPAVLANAVMRTATARRLSETTSVRWAPAWLALGLLVLAAL
jgi:mxaL protein